MNSKEGRGRGVAQLATLWAAALSVVALLFPMQSHAIPIFARQTGQNCLACHAGGQFPELTPYGRKFKLTGYTIGQRVEVPLALMAVASMAKTDNVKSGGFASDPDIYKNGQFDLTTASLFCCGKLSDNVGLFGQWTYDVYDHTDANSHWVPKGHADQIDLRYADRFIRGGHDLIVGASLNNNPGVTDVWNTHNSAFTPVPTYVPMSNASFSAGVPADVAAAPFIEGEGQAAVGATAYAYLDDQWYGEAGLYKTAEGIFSWMNESRLKDMGFPNRLKGYAPYWRFAWNHDWEANSVEIGTHGMSASSYTDAQNTSSPVVGFLDYGLDAQYQYLLDPQTVTAMLSWTHEDQHNPGDLIATGGASNTTDSMDYYRAKGTWVWRAKYGASLAYTSVTGTSDPAFYSGSVSGRPNSKLWVPEVFYTPVQYLRIGLQYYDWIEFNGSKSNVTANTDPTVTNRKASDNNTLVLYVWAAY